MLELDLLELELLFEPELFDPPDLDADLAMMLSSLTAASTAQARGGSGSASDGLTFPTCSPRTNAVRTSLDQAGLGRHLDA